MSPRISVIGSANIDYIMQMSHLPQLGETVSDAKFLQAYGGKGANQAVAAARAGASVCFVGALGNDSTALAYKQSLERDGIDCSRLTLETDCLSGSALVMFDHKGDNYISVAPGANVAVSPQRIQAEESLIQASDWIILQQEIPQLTNQAVLSIAAKYQRPVLFNYAPANDRILDLDASVHGLVVNEIEAGALLDLPFDSNDSSAVAEVACQLRERGNHRFVVVTLGAHGLTVADADSCTHIPCFQVEAVDATAAGDTFCGVLALALGEGRALLEAARFASAASALAVTKVGAQTSIPTRREIDAFLKTELRL